MIAPATAPENNVRRVPAIPVCWTPKCDRRRRAPRPLRCAFRARNARRAKRNSCA